MDNDRVTGIGKKIIGSVKEAVGKMTGDKKTEAEGKGKKVEGEAQNTYGSAKDTVRDALK